MSTMRKLVQVPVQLVRLVRSSCELHREAFSAFRFCTVQAPDVNNNNAAYTDSEASYTSVLGARAGAIIGLVVTIAFIVISGYAYWKHATAQLFLPKISLILLALSLAQFTCSCITVGCFNTAISSQNSYLTSGRHWTAGKGLSLNIVGLVSSIATLGLTVIAVLDAQGYPPSKWSAALREKVSTSADGGQQDGSVYAQLHGDVETGNDAALERVPQRSSVERGGALPQL